jgi:prepilin-type N-terminal cleavage/methylation domain-containing protein
VSPAKPNPRSPQSGFTLIELLVVVGILGVLLAITIVALNPAKHFIDARNASRTAAANTILDAIYEYEASNGGRLPGSMNGTTGTVTTSAKSIAGPSSGSVINLCDIAPTYLADLPTDPSTGSVTGGSTPCAATTTAYDTKYTILTNAAANRLTVNAPGAENSVTISITK